MVGTIAYHYHKSGFESAPVGLLHQDLLRGLIAGQEVNPGSIVADIDILRAGLADCLQSSFPSVL